MCGRFTLKTPAQELASLFNGLNFGGLQPRYNVCPTQLSACVRTSAEGVNEVAMLRWGLVPSWADDLKIGPKMINARSETVATKPSFRAAFQRRRCLVLADGFYEWKKDGKAKQPYYISQVDGKAFALAGLWESWRDPESEQVHETFTVLTTEANQTMQPLHHRMPVFLNPEDYSVWLDVEFKDASVLESLLIPCAEDRLHAWQVEKLVNKPINDRPECILPLPKGLFD